MISLRALLTTMMNVLWKVNFSLKIKSNQIQKLKDKIFLFLHAFVYKYHLFCFLDFLESSFQKHKFDFLSALEINPNTLANE
jgi:hypothetical protein